MSRFRRDDSHVQQGGPPVKAAVAFSDEYYRVSIDSVKLTRCVGTQVFGRSHTK